MLYFQNPTIYELRYMSVMLLLTHLIWGADRNYVKNKFTTRSLVNNIEEFRKGTDFKAMR